MPVICGIITQLCYVGDLSVRLELENIDSCMDVLPPSFSISISWLKHILIYPLYFPAVLSLSLSRGWSIYWYLLFFPANTACHIKISHEQLKHTAKLRPSFRWFRKLENTREWLFRCHTLKNSIQLTRKSLVLVLFLILPRSLVLLSFLSYFVLDIIS